MAPPPLTPTPKRFLASKRVVPPQSSADTPVPSAAPRFYSTPRFGQSSISRTKPRLEKKFDDVEEATSESESEVEGRHDTGIREDHAISTGVEGGGSQRFLDPIEVESDAVSASQDEETEEALEGDPILSPASECDEAITPTRERKRRKMTSSPDLAGKTLQQDSNVDEVEQDTALREGAPSEVEASLNSARREFPGRQTQQPVFRPPPRFKQAEENEVSSYYESLPEAFSPHRKGQRYLAGGMAATLQGWLSEVKGWDSSTAADSTITMGSVGEKPLSSLRFTVENVRPGSRMYLVTGRLGGDQSQGRLDGHVERRSFILAGEGTLTGLSRRANVEVGSLVVVGQPVWDVQLVDRLWTVACNWVLEQ